MLSQCRQVEVRGMQRMALTNCSLACYNPRAKPRAATRKPDTFAGWLGTFRTGALEGAQ